MYVFHYNHFNFTFLCHTCPWSYCRSGEDVTTNVPYMTYDVALKLSKKDLVFRPLITYYAMRTLQLVFIEVQVSWNRTKFGRFKNYIDNQDEIKSLIHCWLINILTELHRKYLQESFFLGYLGKCCNAFKWCVNYITLIYSQYILLYSWQLT